MRKLFSKIMAPLAAALVAALGFGSVASAAIIGPITLNGSATSGGNLSISGLCGTGATGNITFSIVDNNGVTTSLNGTTTGTGTNSQFNTTVTIPTSVSGNATLIANCGSGNLLEMPLSVAASTTGNTNGTITNGNTNLDIVTGNPFLGGTITVNGTCPSGTVGSNVTFSVMQNGTSTPVSSNFAPLSSTGTFSATVNVPATGLNTGSATLVANCGNGVTVTAPLSFSINPVPFITINGTPVLGNNITVNGTCAANASGNVSFQLLQNGITTNLVPNPNPTTIGSNGLFSTTLTLPSTSATGNATLLATCNGVTTPIATNLTLSANNNNNNGNNNTPTGSLQFPSVLNLGLFVAGDPSLSNGVNVSGTCPTNTGLVNFSVLQGGVTTNLTGSTPINADGTFAAHLSLPATLTVGPATIVANCNMAGNTNTTVSLTSPATVVLGASASPTTNSTVRATNPSVLGASATPSVLGASTGMGGAATSNDSAIVITVLVAMIAIAGALFALQKRSDA